MKYKVKGNLPAPLREKGITSSWTTEIVGKVFTGNERLTKRTVEQAAFPPFSDYVSGTIEGFSGSFTLPLEALENYE